MSCGRFQLRRDERGVAEDRLLGDGEERAALLDVRRRLLRVERVESGVANLLREERADEFEAVGFIDREIELRERVEIL
jgi:hypothetical protein